MQKFALVFSALAVFCLALAGCSDNSTEPGSGLSLEAQAEADDKALLAVGKVVVANRGSGTISVIDAWTAEVSGTYALPATAGEPTPEPMYVVHTKPHHRVFVGDRANNRVAVFDDRSFEVIGTVPAGNGVFHMWADFRGRQLWVNNDIDNTTTVIDPGSLTVITTVPTPADLVGMGGKPHDVILDPRGGMAFVSVLGVAGDNDYVVQFSTSTFAETGRAAVGKDPHLSLNQRDNRLYVPCQNSNVVVVLNRFTMVQETEIAVPGAHGAGMTRSGRFFYTTNLPGGGVGALYTIDTMKNSVVGDPVDSPYPVPHNIALAPNGMRMFVTHSGGAADKVSVFGMRGWDPTPDFVTEVTVGLNPFGIAWVQ
jgi:YVTN family beta-propeller protein